MLNLCRTYKFSVVFYCLIGVVPCYRSVTHHFLLCTEPAVLTSFTMHTERTKRRVEWRDTCCKPEMMRAEKHYGI